MLATITVYCSSSTHLDEDFHAPAVIVGCELATRGIRLVYGGGGVGLMGVLARAARQADGGVTGVITQRLLDAERGNRACDDLIIVNSMHERKRIMAERGDAFLVLPGGLGTYEEFFEILTGRQLGEHNKPIGIVNVRGYFNPLIAMIEHGIEHRFMQPAVRELFFIDPDPIVVIDHLLTAEAVEVDDDRFLPMGRGVNR